MHRFHERIHFREIGSTHSYAMSRGAELPDRMIVTADFQREGRGRRGRVWSAPIDSSLLFSIVLKPGFPPATAPLTGHMLAASISAALEDAGVPAYIRWPNDVMAGKAKIAGVLAEASVTGERLDFVVVSAGINVNQDRAALAHIERPATSLLIETGRPREPMELMQPLLSRFGALYDSLRAGGAAAVAKEWQGRCCLTGERVALDLGSRIVEGVVRGFSEDGSIIIEEGPGRVSSHSSGEVIRLACGPERT
ncbi:MAG: biotin--[acetyl-CoA-carboxylase] ligase [Proteobacteria bacterium]|nr:biotin--[acetyl-CoA-carboxylase] ligase [Pseudomonadota bacterium]